MQRGRKRSALDSTDPDAVRSKKVMDAPSPSHQPPPLDPQRAESSRQHVRALNTQFASWVQLQLQNHSYELWEDGVKDYLSHASHIMEKFKDVVEWLRSNAVKSGSISTSGSPNERNNLFTASENYKALSRADINNGSAQASTSSSIPSLQNSWSSFSGQSLVPSQSSSSFFSGQSSSSLYSGQSSSLLFSGQSMSSLFRGQSTSSLFSGQSTSSLSSGQGTSSLSSGQGTSSLSSGQSTGSLSSGQSTSSLFSGQSTSSLFSGQSSALLSSPQSSGLFPSSQCSSLFQSSQSTGLFPSSQSSGLFPTSQSMGFFTNSQSLGLFSSNQKPAFPGTQPSTSPKVQASDDVDEENEMEKPSSPSLKRIEEKGVVVVHEVKCKVYVKADDSAEKSWKDIGVGQLSIKCKEGVNKATKESKPTIVIRNDVGKILLNALIYPGIKMNIQKKTIASIFHTSGGGIHNGVEGDNIDVAVARTYLFRLKTEEETTKLATAIKEHTPST